VLAVVCVVAAALHSSTLVVFGGIAVACDMIYRYVIEPKRKQFPHNSKVSAVGDVVKISVPKGSVAYQGGQYFFINLPTVAKVEYHPISISSAPHEDNLTFHAKALGDWSKELLKQVQAGASMMPINIEGPLGSCTADIWSEKFQVFVLVAGGIGVTPLRSVCRQLMDQHTRGRPMVHIRFVWILRDETLVQAVGTLDTDDGQHRHGVLHPEYYFTRNRMPAGGLNGSVVEGRPDLSKIFHDVAEIGAAAGQSSVAVLNCGPHPMVSSSERIAAKVSSSKVYFTVHSELFDF
jgi:NADPH oxidase